MSNRTSKLRHLPLEYREPLALLDRLVLIGAVISSAGLTYMLVRVLLAWI